MQTPRARRAGLLAVVLVALAVVPAGAPAGTDEPAVVVHLRWPQWSPDGRRIAFIRAVENRRDREVRASHLYVTRGGRARRLAAADGVTSGPAWSPSGRTIAFTRRGRELWLIGADRRNERLLADLGSERLYHPAWSPDGRSLAVGTETALKRVDAATGTVGDLRAVPRASVSWSRRREIAVANGRYLLVLDEAGTLRRGVLWSSLLDSGFVWPDWSPDGRRLAFGHWPSLDRPPTIAVCDAFGRKRRELVHGRYPDWSPGGRRILFSTPTRRGDRLATVAPSGNGMRLLRVRF